MEEDIFTLTVSTAVVQRLALAPPREPPEEPPEPKMPDFIFLHAQYEEEGAYPCAPTVLYTYPPRLAIRVLKAAMAAAEVYAVLARLPPARPEWFIWPDRWVLGAAVFGHKGVVSCAVITTALPAPTIYALGAVRGPGGWWGIVAPLSKWEKAWATGEAPETLPVPLPPEPLDSAIADALRRAAPPPLPWLAEYEREVGRVVMRDYVDLPDPADPWGKTFRQLRIPHLLL